MFAGCAEVPKESVQLSVTLGRDLKRGSQAHRELAVKYFARIKEDINDFVDNTYRPYMIKTSMRDFRIVERIVNAESTGSKPDALEIMDI